MGKIIFNYFPIDGFFLYIHFRHNVKTLRFWPVSAISAFGIPRVI